MSHAENTEISSISGYNLEPISALDLEIKSYRLHFDFSQTRPSLSQWKSRRVEPRHFSYMHFSAQASSMDEELEFVFESHKILAHRSYFDDIDGVCADDVMTILNVANSPDQSCIELAEVWEDIDLLSKKYDETTKMIKS